MVFKFKHQCFNNTNFKVIPYIGQTKFYFFNKFFNKISIFFQPIKNKTMSKDKGGKNDKKAASTTAKSSPSDYQSGKSKSRDEVIPAKKKK